MTSDLVPPKPSADLAAVRAQVRGLTEEWRTSGRYRPRSDSWLRSFDHDFSRRLAGHGLLGITWPRRYGGRDGSNLMRVVVTEELLRAGAPVAAHWIGERQIGPAILRHGSQRLRQEILPGIAAAEYLFCLGMSEPDAGSDLAAVRTRAVRAAGGWRLNGHKVWTSVAHQATHAYVLARTQSSENKHEGLSEFVVGLDSPGVLVSPIVDLSGEHHFNEVRFDDVPVPEHRLLGAEGKGWSQVVEQLSFERGGPERVLSTYPLLMAVIERLDQSDEAALRQLGLLVSRLSVLRRMYRDIALAMDAGRAPVQESATLKLLGNRFELDVIEFARPILGGADAGPDSAFGQALLASPGFSLRGGASEVLLSIIAKQEARE
jgi:alkylation response protein AidB-like acyl-CoA dehydrogenase